MADRRPCRSRIGDIDGLHAMRRRRRAGAPVPRVHEPFPIEETACSSRASSTHGYPHFVADDAGRIVGWCDIIAKRGRSTRTSACSAWDCSRLSRTRARVAADRSRARRGAATASSRSSSRSTRAIPPRTRCTDKFGFVERAAWPRAQGRRRSTTTCHHDGHRFRGAAMTTSCASPTSTCRGKRVFIRADLNVPQDDARRASPTTRASARRSRASATRWRAALR